jgi:anti-anti-sigma factor
MDLRTTTLSSAGHEVLVLDGVADLASLPRLHDALQKFVGERTAATSLAVDLEGVSVLDDAALGLLLGAAATAREQGVAFRVVCADARLRARLAASRFDRAVVVAGSLGEAVADTGV